MRARLHIAELQVELEGDEDPLPLITTALNPAEPIITAPMLAPPVRRKKRASSSPTQRSLKHMREQGYLCQVVEKWNPHARIRQDLFGFIDVLCVKGEDIVGVQACSGTDVSKRVDKIADHENWPLVQAAIRVLVHGWRKNAAGRWMLREIELS